MSEPIPTEESPPERSGWRSTGLARGAGALRSLAARLERGAERLEARAQGRPAAAGPSENGEQTAAAAKAGAWSRMTDAERAFCIVSVLPMIAYLALPFLKQRIGNEGIFAVLPIGAATAMFSWLMAGLGLLAVVYAQRAGRPVWPTVLASLVAGSVVIWSILRTVAILVLRPYLIEMGLY